MREQYKNILIIKPSALGDVITALPALAALRKSFPDARISWFVRPEFAPLLDQTENLDDKIIFDRKLLGKWWCKPKAFKALLQLFSQLRKGKYDLVIDLQGLFRTALFAWLTGCKNRYGMKNSREFASILYTHKIAQPSDSNHVMDYYRAIVTAAGATYDSVDFGFTCPCDAVEPVNRLLTEHSIGGRRFVVFVPSAAHEIKCWPVEHFAALADRITQDYGMPVAAVGSAKEKALIDEIVLAANVPIANFAGLTNLPKLTALLDKASLVVTNDTGPGHMAVALSTPTIMIFGPTNPSRIRPYGRADSVAAIDPDSRPQTIECRIPKYSIGAVTVDHVYGLVAKHLQKIGEKPLETEN